MEVPERQTLEKKNSASDFLPLALLAAFILIFLPTFNGLFSRWIKWDEGLSHGLLVNAVFVYFLLKSLPWQTYSDRKFIVVLCYIGLGITSLAWFIFRLANIYILEQLLLLVLLAGLYACSFGTKAVIQHRLLLLLPIFTIPIWEQLNDVLVNLSGFIVGKMVQLISMPAVIEGNSIFIPYGHIVIADGCSGLRYFEIALALAYIIGILNNYNEKRLLPTLIIAAALGLLANWIRIFALVIIGYQSKMQSPLMSDHEYFGWALFGMLCLPAIYFAPIVKASVKEKLQDSTTLRPRIIVPLFILSLGPILSIFIDATPEKKQLEPVLAPSAQFIPGGQLPVAVNAPDNGFREKALFNIGGSTIYAEIDQYQRVNQSDKLVPYISRLYNNEEWIAEHKKISVSSHSAILTTFKQKSSDKIVLQIQWFEVGQHKIHSLALAKFLQIPALVSGANNFKIVTLQAICANESCEQAQSQLIGSAPTLFINP